VTEPLAFRRLPRPICREPKVLGRRPLTFNQSLIAQARRRYERQLVDARSELQKGLASERKTAELREQFIAVLGHDLRNPLAAISAGARILQRSGALQQQLRSSASST
jgi:signal transduction histidine kinase